MTAPRRAALVGSIVAALVTLPGLGIGTLWDNSETAYGEVAREILLTHDTVVMHLNGAPWFVQPPLYFWIAALFAKLFGVNAFALRLPAALATIAMGGAVGWTTARIAGERAGIFASVVLSTSLMQAIVGRLAIMDALLDLAVTAGVLWWFRAFSGAGDDRAFVLGWVALGFGFLAKGPVAPAIVVLVIVGWVVYEAGRGDGRIRIPAPWAWALGIVLAAAIALPWFFALASREGVVALEQLVGHYTVGRYLGTIENQTGPVWYYLPVIILGFFPWVAFLPSAFVSAVRANGGEEGSLARLAVAWSVLPVLFFSFAQTKLPNYIALEFPALAILLGVWFDGVAQGRSLRAARISGAFVPITIGAIAFAISRFSTTMRLDTDTAKVVGDLVGLGVILLAGSLLTLFLLFRRPERAPLFLGGSTLLAILVIALVAEPHAEPLKPIPSLARAIRERVRPDDTIAIQGVSGGNALLFYTRPKVVTLNADETSVADNDPQHVLCDATRAFVVTSSKRPASDPTYGRNRTEIARSNKDVLYLYDGPRCGAVSARAGDDPARSAKPRYR